MNGINEFFSQLSGQFWVGVLSAATVALLVFVIRQTIAQLFSMLAGIISSSRVIRGKWTATFWRYGQKSVEEVEHVEVYQFFHLVWGTIDYPEKNRIYKFKGCFRDNILVATYEERNKNIIDKGAFTLMAETTGSITKLNGKYSWTDDDIKKPQAGDYRWENRPQ